MLTKEFIAKLKIKSNNALAHFADELEDDKSKLFLLNNLGRLPSDFKGDWLAAWLVHKNPKIRLSTIQNIGNVSSYNKCNTLNSNTKKGSWNEL